MTGAKTWDATASKHVDLLLLGGKLLVYQSWLYELLEDLVELPPQLGVWREDEAHWDGSEGELVCVCKPAVCCTGLGRFSSTPLITWQAEVLSVHVSLVGRLFKEETELNLSFVVLQDEMFGISWVCEEVCVGSPSLQGSQDRCGHKPPLTGPGRRITRSNVQQLRESFRFIKWRFDIYYCHNLMSLCWSENSGQEERIVCRAPPLLASQVAEGSWCSSCSIWLSAVPVNSHKLRVNSQVLKKNVGFPQFFFQCRIL